MLVTLAAVVFFSAILIFFSQEFTNLFKKIFAIKGAKLLLPLAIGSWVVFNLDYWCLWILYYYREFLHGIISGLTYLIPFQQVASYIALIILLTLVSVVPVLILDVMLWKKNYKRYEYPYVTSTIIWITTAVLLIVMR